MLGLIQFLKKHERVLDAVAILFNLCHGNKGYLKCLLGGQKLVECL